MNSVAKNLKLYALWGKIKQHKLISVIVCLAAAATIILTIILALPKTYEIGHEINGKYFSAKVWSVEYTDNAAGKIKADEGYVRYN